MITIQDAIKDVKLDNTGSFTIEAESKDKLYYRVQNHEDGSTFPIKKETLKRKVESGDYTMHEDGSFDMKNRKETTIEWS